MTLAPTWVSVLASMAATVLLSDQGRAPRFEDYPATDSLHSAPVRPVLIRPADRRFRTVITQGAAKGPNFAGTHTVIVWGCGTSCQSGVVVDARTGRVWGFPQTLVRGAQYTLTSRLFVANPVPPTAQPYESPYVTYYEWRDSTFVLIDSLRVPNR
jgi:hypothetical protein